MMTVYLVPAGATDLSKHGELLGINNPSLNEAGRSNASRVAGMLSPLVLEAVFSGSLIREFETAEAIAKLHRLPVRVDNDIRDINFGRWSGRTWNALEATEGDALSKLLKSPHKFRFPSGDRMKRSGKRIQAFIQQILSNYGTGNLVVVADDFVISLITSMMVKTNLSDLEPFKPSQGMMTVIECEHGACALKRLRDE